MMSGDSFHQRKSVDLSLGRVVEPGELNILLKRLGFRLAYDRYVFERKDEAPTWQSTSIVSVEFFHKGRIVDAQEACDQIEFVYLLATLDSKHIPCFAEKVQAVAEALNGKLSFRGNPIDGPGIVAKLSECVSDLLKEWGEEPGSKELRIMIENSFA